jgi:hypothetical protein
MNVVLGTILGKGAAMFTWGKSVLTVLLTLAFITTGCAELTESQQALPEDEQPRTVYVTREVAPESNEELEENEEAPELAEETVGQTPVEETPSETSEPIEADDNLLLNVGETATIGGLSLTLEEAWIEEGGEYDTLQQGQAYLVVQMRVENDSGETINFGGSGIDFYAYNQDSYELDGSLTETQLSSSNREDQELAGQARPGADISGTLAFTVSEGDSALVEFTPNYMMEGAAASWEVGPISELETFAANAAGSQYRN